MVRAELPGSPIYLRWKAMDAPLADLLHPLPVAALGVFLRGVLDETEDAYEATVVDLARSGFVGFSVSDIRAVAFKVRATHPRWLVQPVAPCQAPAPACALCGGQMELGSPVDCHILTFAAGLRPFRFLPYWCCDCNRFHAGGWGWVAGQPNAAQVEHCDPSLAVRFLSLAPKAASVVAMDTALYNYLTATLVHVRASFRGFCAVLEHFHAFPHVEHLHNKLLHGWMLYQAIDFLRDTHWERLRTIAFSFSRHQPLQRACFAHLVAPMQDLFRRRYAQEHKCVECVARPALSLDGKVNRAVPVCQCPTGTPLHMLRGNVVLDFGCLRARRPGSLACALHHTRGAIATTSVLCLLGHRLQRCDRLRLLGQSCDLCGEAFPLGVVAWRCALNCDWRICHACATTTPLEETDICRMPTADFHFVEGVAELADNVATVMQEPLVMAEEGNPCGIEKSPAPASAPRFYGGMVAASLACGRVAFIQPLAGHESLTQVFGLLAAIRSRRALDFVVYDNACALARFVRRLARREPSSVRSQCAALTFCLDRFHAQNHTACRNPRHSLFLPEVDIEQYPVLQDFNSSASEQFNSWLELFMPIMRPMLPETFDCFVLLLAILWNDIIIPGRVTCPTAGLSTARPTLLKRRQGS